MSSYLSETSVPITTLLKALLAIVVLVTFASWALIFLVMFTTLHNQALALLTFTAVATALAHHLLLSTVQLEGGSLL